MRSAFFLRSTLISRKGWIIHKKKLNIYIRYRQFVEHLRTSQICRFRQISAQYSDICNIFDNEICAAKQERENTIENTFALPLSSIYWGRKQFLGMLRIIKFCTITPSDPPKKPVTFIVMVEPVLLAKSIMLSGGSNFQWQTYELSLKGRLMGPVILPVGSRKCPPQATNNALDKSWQICWRFY